MTRTKIFLVSLTAALAFPAIASAHCGSMQGSFAVRCEQGVTVYRHNALSAIPRGLTPAQAKIKAQKIRQQTEMSRLAAADRASARNEALRNRELDIEQSRLRLSERRTTRRTVGYGGGYGYTIARPIRVRTIN